MKSSAFNLAFKVHRNDLSFPEGLLKAFDDNAHFDFVEALNSLAGEQKYDVNALENLVEDARSSVEGVKKPQIDLQALQEEIEKLEDNHKDHLTSIQILQSKNSRMKPTVVPGVNSSLIGLVGGVIALILFLAVGAIGGLIALAITLIVVAFLYIQDLEKLKEEKNKIARNVERNLIEIQKIKALVEDIEKKLNEKKKLLNTAQGLQDKNSPKAQQSNDGADFS